MPIPEPFHKEETIQPFEDSARSVKLSGYLPYLGARLQPSQVVPRSLGQDDSRRSSIANSALDDDARRSREKSIELLESTPVPVFALRESVKQLKNQ